MGRSTFYPPSLFLSNYGLSCRMLEDPCPIRLFSSCFLIMKEDFWSVYTIQAGHSPFNVANIR